MMKHKFFSLMMGILIMSMSFAFAVDAREGDEFADNRGARTCYNYLLKRNVPADYVYIHDFNTCVNVSGIHTQNTYRDLRTAVQFWTPEMVEKVRRMDGRGSRHGQVSAAQHQEQPRRVKLIYSLAPLPDTTVDATQ